MADLGYSFNPSTPPVSMGGSGGGPRQPASGGGPQSAVEIRNLSIPKRLGPNPIAPSALLNAPGASGAGVGLAQLLPLLMQMFAPQGQQPGVPSLAPFPGGGYQAPGAPSGGTLANDQRPMSNTPSVAPGYTPAPPPNATPAAPSVTGAPSPSPRAQPQITPLASAPSLFAATPHISFERGADQPSGAVTQDIAGLPSASQLNDNGGQFQWSPGFRADQVPDGIPLEWAQRFIANNPGDYGRLASAYRS
jgi:hypothetical protein